MNIKSTLLALLCYWAAVLPAQEYTFSASMGTYEDLVESISLNDGMTWDDPAFTIPIGFDFQYAGATLNEIYIDFGLGGLLITDVTLTDGKLPLIVPYGADIIDRAYDLAIDEPTEGSLSNISFLLDGEEGSRILKIEWNNVGFFSDLAENGNSIDFTNFQLWLYEGTNDIEMHFGPNSITQPDLAFDTETGTFAGLFPGYNFDQDEITGPAIIVTGDAASPVGTVINSLEALTYINGIIPEGSIFRFSTDMSSSTRAIAARSAGVQLYPNPSDQFIRVSMPDQSFITGEVAVLNAMGQRLKWWERFYDGQQLDVSDLIRGIYFLQIDSQEGRIVKKFTKQ